MFKMILIAICIFVGFTVIPPFIGGGYYTLCGTHVEEQIWLDRAVIHLRLLSLRTRDPELKEILNYTIENYNRIGAWNVMVMPLLTFPGADATIGCNVSFCPGLTLAPEVLHYRIHEGALVLVHEALHDRYWGHSKINPIMERIGAI